MFKFLEMTPAPISGISRYFEWNESPEKTNIEPQNRIKDNRGDQKERLPHTMKSAKQMKILHHTRQV